MVKAKGIQNHFRALVCNAVGHHWTCSHTLAMTQTDFHVADASNKANHSSVDTKHSHKGTVQHKQEMAEEKNREHLKHVILQLLNEAGGSFPKHELWNRVWFIYGKGRRPSKQEFGFERMEEIFDYMRDVIHIDTSGDKPLVILNTAGYHRSMLRDRSDEKQSRGTGESDSEDWAPGRQSSVTTAPLGGKHSDSSSKIGTAHLTQEQKQQLAELRDCCVEVLKQLGSVKKSKIGLHLNKTYRRPFCLKDLGIKRLDVVFDLFDDFIVKGETVTLNSKHTLGTELLKHRGRFTSTEYQTTAQSPISLSTSNSDTDSDSNSDDVKITRVVKPSYMQSDANPSHQTVLTVSQHQSPVKVSSLTDSSGFLSLDVPNSEQNLRIQQTMVFANKKQEEKQLPPAWQHLLNYQPLHMQQLQQQQQSGFASTYRFATGANHPIAAASHSPQLQTSIPLPLVPLVPVQRLPVLTPSGLLQPGIQSVFFLNQRCGIADKDANQQDTPSLQPQPQPQHGSQDQARNNQSHAQSDDTPMSSHLQSRESIPPSAPDKPSLPPHPLPPQEPTWPPSSSRLGTPPGVPRERKNVSWRPVSYTRGRVTKAQLEGVAQDCIDILAETGDFVSPDRVFRLLLDRFQVRNLRDLQVPGIQFPYQIECINQHERMLCKVNASIEAFSKSRSLCTLFELGESLEDFVLDKGKFETLKLGPLQCLPEVYRMFKFPPDENIPEITSADVLEVLSDYLTQKNKWTNKLEMEDVMMHFMKHYNVSSAYSLGIRIRSLPLVTQVLKKSHRDSAATRRLVVQRFKDLVEKEVAEAFRKVKATILQETSEGSVEIRKHYARIPAEAVIVELMQKFRLLMSLFTPDSRAERKHHDQLTAAVTQFLNMLTGEPLGRMLLHLAVCIGVLDLQESAMELLAGPGHSAKGTEDQNNTEQPKPRQPPSKEALMGKLRIYVERCLAQGPLSLSHLDRIEEKLLEDFGFPTFVAMGFGRFLNFFVQDPAPRALLEECGGIALGTTSSSHSSDSGLVPHLIEVLEFIRQCQAAGMTQEEEVERAMCHQFQVRETRQLGYGNITRLTASAEKPGKHHSKGYHVLFEAALCGKSSGSVCGKREVGILGSQTKEAALACLQSCPLLEDLENWSHWSLVFEPQHGRLRDFLQKYGGIHTLHLEGGQKIVTTDIVALETRQGCLLRLVTNTSPTLYQESVSQQDARAACGHLASLLMANRGTQHLPLTLLANHTRAALYAMHANASTSAVPGGPHQGPAHDDPAVQFVLACLLLLPLRLCAAVADQLFLEPLGQVVGSSRSKSLLLEACLRAPGFTGGLSNASPWASARQLARLGCLLGVQEWIVPLTESFIFPAEIVTVTRPRQPEFRDELQEGDDIEEEMEDESETDEVSDSASFLSDDQDDVPDVQPDLGTKDDIAEKQVSEETSSEEETGESDYDDDDDDSADNNEDEEEEENKEESTAESKQDTEEEASKNQDGVLDSEKTTQEDLCRRVIEQIRRDEFGVGIELSEDGQRLMKVQQERLGRSLDRLSRDLYTKDTHFVLELVQNADDNTYPESLTQASDAPTTRPTGPNKNCPSVKFVIEADCVKVLNNECGFEETNVRALCDVGRSTKGKHKYGYIGQKGIGFKSVFRVTNRPEVHSNGFHLCFDINSGPMGYILPHWCEDLEPSSEWMTKIVLPLKETKMCEAGSLAARFNDIHPSLLLFLHRLRYIHIDNKVEHTSTWMRRQDLGDSVVQIEHGDKEMHHWLVVRKQLDASAISLQAKSGVEVESTEIALAFPLASKTQRFHSQAPAKQPVFAYLPLRSYGFRFIVQGDFDVPSSREDVDRDSSWNQWLRDEIHTLFVEALDVFRSHPEFEGLESLWAYLRFVPLEDEILDFFRPVAARILQQLRATSCIPISLSQSSKKDLVQWKLPSQTVMVKDSLVREVISPDLLERHLGLYYVHKEAVDMMSPELARSLGVESLTSDHLVQMGKSLALSWGQQVDQEEVIQISKWLACIYRSLDDLQENATLINILQSMNVIPLSTGKLVSLCQTTVFLMHESGQEEGTFSGKRDALYVLQQDLQVLHSGLVMTPDAEINSQVFKLLMRLGVKQLSPNDIIHHHILPILQSDRWQTKSRDVLVSYLMYLKQQYHRDRSLVNMNTLRTVARVLTNQGIKNPATEPVHFSPAFGTQLDLQKELPGYDWVIVDSQYLPSKPTRAEVLGWQEFLAQLGVTVFLVVQPRKVTFTADQLANTPWDTLKDMWPASQDGYTIEDFVCEEFQQLVSNNSAEKTRTNQMALLFSLLDKAWDTQYQKFANTQLYSSSGTLLKDQIPSSFAIAIQNEHWVPCEEMVVTMMKSQVQMEQRQVLLPPSAAYLPEARIRNLLAHTVNYLSNPISSDSTFARFLNIKAEVEVQVLRNALVSWGKRTPKTPDEPATFVSSLQHLKNVYGYLCDNLTPKEAQDLFHLHPVIFVPVACVEGNDLTKGHMLGRDEVWWQDPSGLFSKYHRVLVEFCSLLAKRRSLNQLYREMSDTLPRTARLQLEPLLVDYAELLSLMSASLSLRDDGVLDDVLAIYTKIGHDLAMQIPPNSIEFLQHQEQVQKITDILKTAKVLVTKDHTWVSVNDKPMLADSPDMEKMFSGKPGVHFVITELPRRQGTRKPLGRDNLSRVDDILDFYALFGLPQLSEEVVKEVIVSMFKPCPQGQLHLRTIVPYLQQFLVSLYPAVYDAHEKDNITDRLHNLLFLADKKLEVKYSLKTLTDVYEIKPEKCVISGSHFYFNEKHVESLVEVNREVARYFSNGDKDCFRDLRIFLTDLQPLVHKGSPEEIAQVLSTHNVGPLPEGFEPWEVPAPFLPEPSSKAAAVAQAVPVEQFSKGEQPSSESVNEEGNRSVLKSWPPPAPGEESDKGRGVKKAASEGRTSVATGVWPPPKPPEGTKLTSNLPSNLHMASASDGSAAEDKQAAREDGSTQTRGKRKSHEIDGEMSESKRPVPIERVGDETSAPTGDQEEGTSSSGAKEHEGQHSHQAGHSSNTGNVPMEIELKREPRLRLQVAGQHRYPPFKPRPDQLQMPIWTQLACETEYEELARGKDLRIPETIELSDTSDRSSVGRWGEFLVYDYLLQQKQVNSDIYDVIWANEQAESGKPYDFEIICTREDEAFSLYIEVKATRTSSKEVFEISANEVRCASENGERYHIYRVFNAGTREVQLVRLTNVVHKMDSKEVRLLMVI
ncbi:uncharacterized protein LOC112553340 isoform X4 [Pomacea canaliculata]|uniref:uncharacterized protein LOC112553340 isoform X4 n=1 Tax=Pomacea canaliculata TaxID=400727 RepID=UPI000D726FE6|nr:uncharacterized protein LOC112553340 isoform X4 [Pomacea canaliculata]